MANLIKDIIVSGSAVTQVDLTGLNIQKGELYEMVTTIIGADAGGPNMFMTFNANGTLSNYYSQHVTANSTTVNGARNNSPFVSDIAITDGVKVKTYIKLSNDGHIVAISKATRAYNKTTPILRDTVITSTYTASSITQISWVVGTNGIGIGSRFQLYKVAEKVVDIEVTGSAVTQIDIDQLDNGDDLFIERGNEYLLVQEWLTTTGGRIFINDDTTQPNYWTQLLRADSTTVAGARVNLPALAFSGGDSLLFSKIKLANSGIVNIQSNNIFTGNGITSLQLQNGYLSYTQVVASITKISIVSTNANDILVGSRFELYKLI